MRNKPKVMTLTTRMPLQHNIAKSVRKEWLGLVGMVVPGQ